MPQYHVYCLDLEGKNVQADVINAMSDEVAVRQARALTGLRQCEVWQGKRMVASINFDRSASA